MTGQDESASRCVRGEPLLERITKIGAAMTVAALTTTGLAALAPALASANDACEDFIKMLIIYDENGYRATADGIGRVANA
jgi:hypothetical protein